MKYLNDKLEMKCIQRHILYTCKAMKVSLTQRNLKTCKGLLVVSIFPCVHLLLVCRNVSDSLPTERAMNTVASGTEDLKTRH